MTTIQTILAKEIFDSEGYPTVEVSLILSDDTLATSSIVLPETENDPKDPYKKTQTAIKAISEDLEKHLVGQNVTDQSGIDQIIQEAIEQNIDLANVGIAVSQAVLRAGAQDNRMPVWMHLAALKDDSAQIPRPIFPLIQGSAYGKKILDFKEYVIIPAERSSFGESLDIGMSIFHSLITQVKNEGKSIVTSSSGGLVPDLNSNNDVLKLIKTAVEETRFSFAHDVFLGINADANKLASDFNYSLKEKDAEIGKGELIDHYASLYKDFSLIYLEEPFKNSDKDSYQKLISLLSSKTLILKKNKSVDANDLNKTMQKYNINGITVDMTTPQTISQYISLAKYSKLKKLSISLTQNDAITQDDIRADIAVGLGCDYANFGVPANERIVLYNRLLSIQQEMHHLQS